MAQRIRNRSAHDEAGFSVVEFLVAIIIVGILLAVSIPSYLGLRDRANDKTAKANVESALPAVEEFYAANGSYAEMTLSALQTIDESVALDYNPTVTAKTYCIQSTVGRMTRKIEGPGDTNSASGSC